MNTTKYRKIFDEHDGIIKLSDFTNAGYHNTELYKLMDQGYVEKIKTGYYEWVADEMVSDAVLISKVFPNGVVCLESALYLYNYIDRTPMKWHIAVSKNSSKSKYKIDYPPIEFYFIIDRYLSIGKTKIKYEGHALTIFDRERTICDVIRYEKKLDSEVFIQSVKAYINDPQRNIKVLIDYSKKMNISNKVNRVIGLWL